mmetsp:Transcript_118237/g.378900  ORF Transcript_118237/g.378900 Transcript_118237/m.378900 type:complete len:339 (+) Transcript_118237:632-1648(+)
MGESEGQPGGVPHLDGPSPPPARRQPNRRPRFGARRAARRRRQLRRQKLAPARPQALSHAHRTTSGIGVPGQRQPASEGNALPPRGGAPRQLATLARARAREAPLPLHAPARPLQRQRHRDRTSSGRCFARRRTPEVDVGHGDGQPLAAKRRPLDLREEVEALARPQVPSHVFVLLAAQLDRGPLEDLGLDERLHFLGYTLISSVGRPLPMRRGQAARVLLGRARQLLREAPAPAGLLRRGRAPGRAVPLGHRRRRGAIPTVGRRRGRSQRGRPRLPRASKRSVAQALRLVRGASQPLCGHPHRDARTDVVGVHTDGLANLVDVPEGAGLPLRRASEV